MPDHYYSPMNFKALVIVVCVLTLSACSSRNKSSDISIDPPLANAPKSNEHVVDVDVPDSLDSENATAEPSASAAETLQEPVEEPKTINIIDRIRDGFAFPEFETKDVAQYERWSSTHPTYLINLFKRAEPFLYYIVEEIEKRGLPMELALLPAVESAYKPDAVSSSRAVGLWQFIPSTGASFGLRQDWWYDGRRDVYSSTVAALDYLKQLNNMFDGDWFITLAAYNAGPGTLNKAIRYNKRKGRKTDYLSLKLRSETRRYIPKLVALKKIILNPSKYDLDLPYIESKPFFELIELPGQIDLVKFSEQSTLDKTLLKNLNRGFKRWATSPDGPHRLLIPINAEQKVDYAKLAAANAPKVNYRNHKIGQGQTLGGIAKQYGVSVVALKSANNLSNSRIRAGKNLLIPIRGNISKARNTQARRAKGNTSQLAHTVKKGDTLWSIARRYQVKLDQLMAWNNLSSRDVLSLNQVLTVFLK